MILLAFPLCISLGISLLLQFAYEVGPEEEKYATVVLKDLLLETGATNVYASSVGKKVIS